MIEEQPTSESPAKSRSGLVMAIIAIGVVVIVAGLWVGLGALGRSSFETLVTVTKTAEGDQLWLDYFIAQDCLIDAVVEAGDLELGYTESLDLLDETDSLSRHVAASLDNFSAVSIQPWLASVLAAREAIIDHYQVWDGHLVETALVLQAINSEPSSVLTGVQTWINLVVEASTPIEETFNEAGVAFREASGSDEQLALIETLFIPAEVSCTRTAV